MCIRDRAKVETAVPNVVGSSVNAAAGKLRESGFNVDIERATGDTVLYQYLSLIHI